MMTKYRCSNTHHNVMMCIPAPIFCFFHSAQRHNHSGWLNNINANHKTQLKATYFIFWGHWGVKLGFTWEITLGVKCKLKHPPILDGYKMWLLRCPPYQSAQWLKWGVEELVRAVSRDHPGQVFRAGLRPQICAVPGKTLQGCSVCRGSRVGASCLCGFTAGNTGGWVAEIGPDMELTAPCALLTNALAPLAQHHTSKHCHTILLTRCKEDKRNL